MRIRLSDHFTYKRLFCFTISTIFMLIFTSLYSIVDGFFVSNFVGKTPFAAVNLIMPVMMGVGTIGFMIGTGGSAIVSTTLGEGKKKQANQYFTMLVYVSIILGLVISLIGFIFVRPISIMLGATDELLENCIIYGKIIFATLTLFILQTVFQSFFVSAEKPALSLKINIISGLLNIVLDFLFIAVFKWGIAGAAIATSIGVAAGGIIPLFYFAKKNNSLLQFTKTRFNSRVFLNTCINGSSEMVTNLSSSVVNILYNFQLMKIAGEDGVAAYGVIMYVNFIFMAVFMGYSVGSAPIISYNYGAANHEELKNLFKKSLILIISSGVVLTIFAEILAAPLVKIFVSYDANLFSMTVRGFKLYSIAFLVMGINVWGSAFFTALNNGIVSALISFLRTFVFQIIAVIVLPIFLDIDGIWLAIVVAEMVALIVTVYFFVSKKEKYKYV